MSNIKKADSPSAIMRTRSMNRDVDRALLKQQARDKALRIKAETDAILSRGLNGKPVNRPDVVERAKFLRRPYRNSILSGGL